MILNQIEALANERGLTIAGYCPVQPEDNLPDEAKSLVLLRPDEPIFWQMFQSSPEMQDLAPDPMDRWSKKVITQIANAVDGTPYFPFGGPPYWPFYTWALRSKTSFESPIRLSVHSTAGLFISFRGAIAVPYNLPTVMNTQSPCLNCSAPCTTSCPVGALTQAGYDVPACKTHLVKEEGQPCRTGGCLARRACPINQSFPREKAQSAFHLDAFIKA